MSLRTKVLRLVEIVLRVPPLFVIDEILKAGLGLSEFTQHDLSQFEEPLEKFDGSAQNLNVSIQYDPTFYKFILASVVRLLLGTLGNYKIVLCYHIFTPYVFL